MLKEACAKADIDDIIDCEPQADSVFQVAAFDYNWPEYLVNVESRTEYLMCGRAPVIDKNTEMISIGKVRNCRDAPRSSDVKDVTLRTLDGTTATMALSQCETSTSHLQLMLTSDPQLALSPVTAHDSITKGTYNFSSGEAIAGGVPRNSESRQLS